MREVMCQAPYCDVLRHGRNNVEGQEEKILPDDRPRCQHAHTNAAIISTCGNVAFLDSCPSNVYIEEDEKDSKAKNGRIKPVFGDM